MMMYATQDPASIRNIQKIVSESFTEIKITSEKLLSFWTDHLLPHLHSGAAFLTPLHNALIT